MHCTPRRSLRHIASVVASGLLIMAPPAARCDAFTVAADNADANREALNRAHDVMRAWLGKRDPDSHLISEHWEKGYWRVENAAADLYASLVVISHFTDHDVRDGFLTRTLHDEQRLCNRVGVLPDDWSFATRDFMHAEPDLGGVIFGASEYCRDGLLRITEWCGRRAWFDRLTQLIDEIIVRAPHDTERGRLPALDHEINGEMLQTLSRLYWMTGDDGYLEAARPIADTFLLYRLPTHEKRLGLSDHGCEIINGLAELFLIECRLGTPRAARYRAPMREMLGRVIEVGANEDGMLYWRIDPAEGTVLDERLSDCWGYVYDAYYTCYLATGDEWYRKQVERVLGSLPKYTDQNWVGGCDGLADSFESAIDLLNRVPMDESFPFLDATIRRAWQLQRPDGSVERWYGDGSFGRACIMCAHWKARGCGLHPWREDLALGACQEGDVLYVHASADEPWTGRLVFDKPRHQSVMRLPVNYPRINELPEWFTVRAHELYRVEGLPSGAAVWRGREMAEGVELELLPGEPVKLAIREVTGTGSR